MAQRYPSTVARDRMAHQLCPECGQPVPMHSPDLRFWVPRLCDLTPIGVQERIAQYRADLYLAKEI